MKPIFYTVALSIMMLMTYLALTACTPRHLTHTTPAYKCVGLEEYGCKTSAS